MGRPSSKKLIIVATRLPITVSKVGSELIYKSSEGGLATGMSTVGKTIDNVWVGWPGISSDELTKQDKLDITKELKKHNCHPVFLNDAQIDDYYSGYCNATIWPLFHYFNTMTEYQDKYWESYETANQLFYNEAKQFLTDKSRVWVHDYQLMLLPQLIREKNANALIGFFLHIPFPSYELFRLLPNRVAILQGLLGSDLIGFHTYDYVRHFLSSAARLLGAESSLGAINVDGRVVQTDAFPIGIDYEKYSKSPQKRKVKQLLKSFDLFKESTKVILSVDRSDYSKGIPARLDAFELFLRQNPEYLGRVVLVVVAVPSREGVEAYQDLRIATEQKVSRINGEFSTIDWSPVSYRYQSLTFDELSALYALADVMMVTPLRDGMNLVAKEYVANHHKSDGVLILSELAGVATELPESILINPSDKQQVVLAIKTALKMPQKQQRDRMRAMQNRISQYDIHKWSTEFMTELERTAHSEKYHSKLLVGKNLNKITADYKRAHNRLILLDYDGTLKSFVNSPDENLSLPGPRLKSLLKQLTRDKKNHVVIVSGRPQSTLTKYFDDKGLGLIAEHGGWIFDAGEWVKSSVASKKWKKTVKPVLDEFTARTPRSKVEQKDFSLVWHYRRVSPDLAYVRKEELKIELNNLLEGSDIGVFEGNKIIEIKPKRMHKGAMVTEILSQQEAPEFIMAIGDDYTDEDMFQALPERAYSIQVGAIRDTSARFQVGNVPEVLKLLSNLVKTE